MVRVYHVKKEISDKEMDSMKNTHVQRKDIHLIIDEDADVFNESGELLLRFRKNVLKQYSSFYDNVIKYAKTTTSNRGSTSGNQSEKDLTKNPKIMSNILGYFDTLSPKQKYLAKQQNKTNLLTVRATRFVVDFPVNYTHCLPFVREINDQYHRLVPDAYQRQITKARQTPFHIGTSAFTTITTNVNFQTTIHRDRGDDEEGFGNLAVIEQGKYEGAETCLPQYGVGVNVRTGDVLFMNVHEWHGNLPMKSKTKDAIRLSVVCYLRRRIWELTRGKSKTFMKRHVEMLSMMSKTRKRRQHKEN
jgi:hypothetical protein